MSRNARGTLHFAVTSDSGVRKWQATATRTAPSCSRSARTSTIFVTKGVAAFITGSGAMLAETVHSLADCGNQLLLLLGLRQARTPPSPDYPLGYGKAIYFWSFLVAVMLFSVGGMFSALRGHPQTATSRAAQAVVVGGRRARRQHRRRSRVDARMPDRGEQGARLAQPRALVSREPPGRADRHLR